MHRLFAGVEPLDRSRGRLPKQPIERSPQVEKLSKKADDAARLDAEAVHEHLRNLVEGRARFEVEDDGVRVAGRRIDVPLDALRRLRRGLLPIDARVDLHGSSAREARTQLELFLRTMRIARRALRPRDPRQGRALPRRPGRPPRRDRRVALARSGERARRGVRDGQGGDGGEGAVYVLLRR